MKLRISPIDSDRLSAEEFAAAIRSMPDFDLADDGLSASVIMRCDEFHVRFLGGQVVADVPDSLDDEEEVEFILGMMSYLARRLGVGEFRRDGKRLEAERWLSPYWAELEKAATAKPVESERPPVTYSPKVTFVAGDRIEHPKFGAGRVERVLGRQIEVAFLDGQTRKLAHGLE